LVHIVNNLHIYDRHVELVKEIIENPEYPAPVLKINPEVKDFYEFTEDDFELVDYQSTKLSKKFEVAE
jgi:thymidylate synthase